MRIGGLVLLLVSAIALSMLSCKKFPFDNPLDPESEGYIGFESEDHDGDGIGQWEDVDEIELISPLNGKSVPTLPLCLVTNKFNPDKVQQYWKEISTSDNDFEGSKIYSKFDYTSNECEIPLGVITRNGTYYWRAKAFDGSKWSDNWSDIEDFNVEVSSTAPSNPSPSSGSSVLDTTPVLNWENVVGASAYQIQVNTHSDFSGTTIGEDTLVGVSQYHVTTILVDQTTYYWRVKARNVLEVWSEWSSVWSFTVDFAPKNPTPSSGNSISDTTPLLIWDTLAGANLYHVQIDTDVDFTGTMVEEDAASTSSMYQLITLLSDNTPYYWHVKVKNEDGVWSDWSSTWLFVVDIQPPTIPYPDSGTAIPDTTPFLRWDDVSWATRYHVQVNTNDTFTGLMLDEDNTLFSSEYHMSTTVSNNTPCFWRVKVKNEDGVWSDWSSVWNIKIDVNVPTAELIDVGVHHSMALKSDGTLWAAGMNGNGQLGTGDTIDRYTFTKVLTGVTAISAATTHSLALKSDGTLWAAGSNSSGQLGTGDTTDRYVFTQVLTGVSAISGGDYFSLVVRSDGTLLVCGDNEEGQLGTGDRENRYVFTQVFTGVGAISAGGYYSLVVRSDGTLWASGHNAWGNLGTGDRDERLTFTEVLTAVDAVSASDATSYWPKYLHSMALKSDGTLWACGANGQGQLGTGDTDDRFSFTQVLTGVNAISAGERYSLALKSDGTLWACGENNSGQLGTGDTGDLHSFTQVFTGVSAISAGEESTMIVKDDDTLWACGRNEHGQLGTGDTTDCLTLTQVYAY